MFQWSYGMKIMAVSVSQPLEFEFEGRAMRSSIFKKPVSGPVALGKTSLTGDGQANLSVHGGLHKAVYAYSHDHYAWWSKTMGRNDLSFGQFGENLTISGLDEDEIYIGDRLLAGTALTAVTGPRIPCAMLGVKFNDKMMPGKFTEAARPGFYLRVIETGVVKAGDPVEIIQTGEGGLSIRDMYKAYTKPRTREACDILEHALTLPDLDPDFIPRINKRLRAFNERTE
jgi:MOSC domain-containing protein YiiM